MDSTPLLKPSEVAELLNISVNTLSDWRWRKVGPEYIRVSASCVRYEYKKVIEFLTQRKEESNGSK